MSSFKYCSRPAALMCSISINSRPPSSITSSPFYCLFYLTYCGVLHYSSNSYRMVERSSCFLSGYGCWENVGRFALLALISFSNCSELAWVDAEVGRYCENWFRLDSSTENVRCSLLSLDGLYRCYSRIMLFLIYLSAVLWCGSDWGWGWYWECCSWGCSWECCSWDWCWGWDGDEVKTLSKLIDPDKRSGWEGDYSTVILCLYNGF